MAYPIIDAPYGLKPINLIGGQVFAGSTRELPIQYGYATDIFYGDFVRLTTAPLCVLLLLPAAPALLLVFSWAALTLIR